MNTRLLALVLLSGCGGGTDEEGLSPVGRLVQALGLEAVIIAPNGLGSTHIEPNGLGEPAPDLDAVPVADTPAPNGLGGTTIAPNGLGRPSPEWPGGGGEGQPPPMTGATCDQACDRVEDCGFERPRRCVPTCRDVLGEAGAEGQAVLDCVAAVPCQGVLACIPEDVLEEFAENASEAAPVAPGRADAP